MSISAVDQARLFGSPTPEDELARNYENYMDWSPTQSIDQNEQEEPTHLDISTGARMQAAAFEALFKQQVQKYQNEQKQKQEQFKEMLEGKINQLTADNLRKMSQPMEEDGCIHIFVPVEIRAEKLAIRTLLREYPNNTLLMLRLEKCNEDSKSFVNSQISEKLMMSELQTSWNNQHFGNRGQ